MRVNSMRKGRLGKDNRDRNVGISCAQINIAGNMHNAGDQWEGQMGWRKHCTN